LGANLRPIWPTCCDPERDRREIASAAAKISPNEKGAIEKPPTTDLRAYDLYLRAQLSLATLRSDPREEKLPQAGAALDEAVAATPRFLQPGACSRGSIANVLAGQITRRPVDLAKDRSKPRYASSRMQAKRISRWRLITTCFRDSSTPAMIGHRPAHLA